MKTANELVAKAINKINNKTKRTSPFSDNLSSVQQELRQRRKQFLGSCVPAREFMLSASGFDEEMAEAVSSYLASRTIFFWNNQLEEAEEFCFRFYRLSLYALASGNIVGECIDDILRLAECLVRSRRVFMIALKEMVPTEMHGELYDFAEFYSAEYYEPTFEDAVLGGICVFLGVLTDPLADETPEITTED